MEKPFRLLIVDDVQSHLDLERTFLRRAVCEVLTASTGLEAIRVAHEHRPDLIVLDIEMPEMNGIEATRVLSGTPALSAIPVVIVSGSRRKEEALAAGAREFAHKPLDEDRFLEMVRRFVPVPVRMDARREIRVPCTLVGPGGSLPGLVADVSVSGALVLTGASLAIGDRLHLAFALPGRPPGVEVRGEAYVVRRAESGYGLGFTALSDADRWRLQEFIAETAD